MPVTETQSGNSDDVFVHIERRKKADRVPNSKRKGFNSRSGMKSMTDKAIAEIEQPTVDKSPAMIKHLRLIGKTKKGSRPEDVLTAQGSALYEFLMASARIQGMSQPGDFRVSYDDAKKYLQIEHNKRLEALADQLRETLVEYDFKIEGWSSRWGKMPLLLTDFAMDRDGNKFILFSIHPAVKTVMLERDTYTKVEINAFAKFKCKYTARIYPRLALIAGFHPAFRKPWKIKPEELAKLIGFTYTGDFHWGNFEKGCLKKVMTDMSEYVLRFGVELKILRKPGRGNPVEWLEFTTSTAEKHLMEHVKAPMTAEQYKALNAELKGDETQFFGEMPSAEMLRIGASKTGFTPSELLAKWKGTLTMMHQYPNACLPDAGLLTGEKVFEKFFSYGVGAAFEHWLYYLDSKVEKFLPFRSADTVYDLMLRVILMDLEVALDYCDPTHPEWLKAAAPWQTNERDDFFAALSVMAQDNVPQAERTSYFTKVVTLLNTKEPDEAGLMIGKISEVRTRKYRLETVG